jgi:hypothetical protein
MLSQDINGFLPLSRNDRRYGVVLQDQCRFRFAARSQDAIVWFGTSCDLRERRTGRGQMRSWHIAFLGLREFPSDLTEFELAFFLPLQQNLWVPSGSGSAPSA